MNRTIEDLGVIRGDLFAHMNSWEFKAKLSTERVERIRRVLAHEQLCAAAMAGNKARTQRLNFWADEARRHGWPDGMVAG